jgi:large repetitive protein
MALTVLGLAVSDILSIKKRGIGADGFVSEIYSAVAGEVGLVDTANTTSGYDLGYGTYAEGVVQTNKLYHSTTAITTLKVNDLRKGKVATGATVDISFDDGSSWSTATNQLNTDITSFTGTSDDSGTYKLKLKFTLGADYNYSNVWVTTGSIAVKTWYLTGCGTISAALSIAGSDVGGNTDVTEIWNGSSWATTGSVSEVKAILASCGTTTAALLFGGSAVNTTEIWSGSSWATTTDLDIFNTGPAGCGTTAAALCAGGYSAATRIDTTRKWNGSSWTTTGSLSEIKNYTQGCGTTAAALVAGGHSGAVVNTTEKWLVSSWTTTTDMTGTNWAFSFCGTTAAALNCGGSRSDTTEIWNGSLWATTTDMAHANNGNTGCGNTTDALTFGGSASVVAQRWLYSGFQKGFAVKIN